MKFIAENDELIIELQGAEILFGFKRKLVIPRMNIASLDWYPEFHLQQHVWKGVGSGIPGALVAGNYRCGGSRYYLYVRHPKGGLISGTISSTDTLVITTRDYPYNQLLFSCQPDIGANLVMWWHQT